MQSLNIRKTGTTIKCKVCGSEVYKTKRQFEKNKNHYCSRKCSCIDGNRIRWDGHITNREKNKCKMCNNPREYKGKYSLCMECYVAYSKEKNGNKTIGDIKKKYKSTNSGWYSSEIRQFSRYWNKELLGIPCQKCGYNKHVELCHIVPIKSFPDNIQLKVVNNEDNLLSLCPNCHYEFDNGLLQLENIPNRIMPA